MSNLDDADTEADLTKHDRLVNAWLAAGEDANVETVASLTGASSSYASQVRQAMEEGELTDDDVDDVTVPDLIERYRQDLERSTADGGDSESTGEDTPDEEARSNSTVQPDEPSREEPPSRPAPPEQAANTPRPPQPPEQGAPRPPQQPPRQSDGRQVRSGERPGPRDDSGPANRSRPKTVSTSQ